MAGVALLLGADPAWRCQFSDLANPPCTPGVLDTCCLPVRTGLRCKYTILKCKAMDFSKELEQRVKEAIEAVPEAVASTAKRYFLERFSEKAFDGEPWKPWGKRYKPGRGTLLVQSGALRKSIDVDEISARRVVITAGGDRVPYARAHNEGFSGSVVVRSHERVSKKGKPYVVKQHTRKMLVPRRRFMGESHELETLIKKDVEQLFKNTMER